MLTLPLRRLALLCLGFALLSNSAQAEVQVKEVISRSGVHAWLIEDHTLPLIALNFAFEGGSAIDPNGKEGLTTLLASTLDEGAGDLDSKAFQNALSERSISLGFTADEDALFGSVKTLTREKDNAFALLRLALHSPRFDEDAISRMKDALVARRQNGLSDANWLAGQAFEQVGMEGHPYARAAGGTAASLRSISRDDLVASMPQHVVKNRLTVAVVGDITPQLLAEALDNMFGDLPQGVDKVELPELKVSGAGETVLVARDEPQTMVMAGLPGIKREDPDWFAATVMNYVLGGDFQSRLMSEIRIKRGLTYGISTALMPYKSGGVLYAMASTDNAKVPELMSALAGEMHKMSMAGVSETELNEAKTYLTGSFALRFNSSEGIAAVLLDVQRLGLRPDYLQKRAAIIEAVSAGDVARLAEQLLKPDAMTVVLVGHPEGIHPTRTLAIQP